MNSQQKITLTSGSLGRNILLFSIPLMLSNVLQVLFNMSDIAVVGQFAGSHALGSVELQRRYWLRCSPAS